MKSHDDRALQDRKKGDASEDRFQRLLSDSSKVPDWIIGVMSAGREDDHKKGIDFYVLTTDSQSIPVDVKSSFAGKKKVARKGKKGSHNTCVIVMRPNLNDEEMRAEAVKIITTWKSQLL